MRLFLYFTISLTHSPHLSVSFVYFLSSSPSRLPPEITCRGIDKLSDHEDSQTPSLSLSLSLPVLHAVSVGYQPVSNSVCAPHSVGVQVCGVCVCKCVLSN